MQKISVARSVDLQTQERFAQAIRELRGSRSYRKFGAVLGVAHTSVIRWERCEAEPDLENLERVAQVRGESLEEFKSWLEGVRQPSPLQRMIQQMYGLPPKDLAELLRAIGDRIASEDNEAADGSDKK